MIAEVLPENVAAAVLSFMQGPLLEDPHRVTKPLNDELEGLFGARRGEYRVLCQIDDENRLVTVVLVAHRRDAYRRR